VDIIIVIHIIFNDESQCNFASKEDTIDGPCLWSLMNVLFFSFEECSKNKSCGIIEGIWKQIKKGSVNGSISGPVIGG
jgi:hypothetical protein